MANGSGNRTKNRRSNGRKGPHSYAGNGSGGRKPSIAPGTTSSKSRFGV